MQLKTSMIMEGFNKEEIDIIVTALMHEIGRYNTALIMIADDDATVAIENAKHKVFEVFNKVNRVFED